MEAPLGLLMEGPSGFLNLILFNSYHGILCFDRIGSKCGFCNFNMVLQVVLVACDMNQLVATLFPRFDGYVAFNIMISLKALKFHSLILFLGL